MRNKKVKRAYAYIFNTYDSDVQKQVEYTKLWGVSNEIHVVEIFVEREPQDYLKRHADASIFERAGLSAWLRAVCKTKDTYALVPRYKDLLDICSAEQWKVLHALLDANRSPLVSATDTYDQMPAPSAPPSEDFMRGLACGSQIGVFTPRWKAPPQLEHRTDQSKHATALKKVKRALCNVIAHMAYEQKLSLATLHFECIRLNLTEPGDVRVLSENGISAQLRAFSRLKESQKYKREQSLSILLRKFHTLLKHYEELVPLTEAQLEEARLRAGGRDAEGYHIADAQYRYHMRSNNLRQRKRGGRRKKEREQPKVVNAS